MKLRFTAENRTTLVRVFANKPAVFKELGKSAALIWDEGVGPAPKDALSLPGGEAVKSWHTVEQILKWLHGAGHERTKPVMALGGGAVCDVAALAASLYRRGVPLVLVPTTLLAQVDAAIGGKTAVDTIDGHKNFAGTFYPASEVWLCSEFLNSLNERERRSGAGELLKILWLAGKKMDAKEIRTWIQSGKVTKSFWRSILQGVQAKIRIVEKDPLDKKRVREALNFGHTVGHALEALGDGAISHGEAVAWGMAVEAGLLRKGATTELRNVLRDLGFIAPEFMREQSLTNLLHAIQRDKKMRSGSVEMSVLDPFGKKKIITLKKNPRLVAESSLRFFQQLI
jgi:3-dehydroquinate synthase